MSQIMIPQYAKTLVYKRIEEVKEFLEMYISEDRANFLFETYGEKEVERMLYTMDMLKREIERTR